MKTPAHLYNHTPLVLVLAIAWGCGGGASPGRPSAGNDPVYQQHRREALSLYGRGDLRGALGEAARALTAAPSLPEAYEFVSKIYVALADDEAAVGFFEIGTRNLPERPESWYYRGFHQFRLDRWDEALASFEKASAVAPDDPDNYFRQGLILQAMGDFDRALEKLRHAHELDPSNGVTAARLARLLRITGAYEDAEAVITRALALSPDSADLHYALGQLMLRDGREEEAEGELRRAITLSPNRWEAHYDLARLLSQTAREQEGRREQLRADRLRNYAETKDILMRRMASRSEDPEAALTLAELDLTEKNIREAQRWLGRAEQLGAPPERIGPAKAELGILTGDLQAAAAALDGLGRSPGPRGELALAAFKLATGKVEEGLTHLRKAVAEGPDEGPFLRRAADLHERIGNNAQAEALLVRAASLPEGPSVDSPAGM